MSLWTCPTHGLHGPCPGNVCPTCGAAMQWTATRTPNGNVVQLWQPYRACRVSSEGHGQDPAQDGAQRARVTIPHGFYTDRALAAQAERVASQRGAQPAEPASGEESPTRGLPYRLSPLHQAHRIAQERAENPYSDPLENAEDFQRIAELLSDALKGDA